eukprot:s530_g8.t1
MEAFAVSKSTSALPVPLARCTGHGGSSGSTQRPKSPRRGPASLVPVGSLVAALAARRSHQKSLRLSRVLKAVEAAEVETETSIQVAAPAKLATTWSRSAEEIFEAGELEALQRAEPGEAKVYPRLRKKDAKAISEAAEELGLCVTREGKSKDLVVYKSGEELLFGTVPYSFDELGLHPVVLSALQRWTPEPLRQATHIQASAIPKILEGQDVSIQSETGSGKTLAYLLPAAHFAAQATYGEDDEEWEDMDDEMLAEQEEEESRAKDHEFEARMPEEPQKSVCYKVKQTATRKGTRLVSRPEEFATPTGKKIYQGDEFMSKSVSGSPLGLHFAGAPILLGPAYGWSMMCGSLRSLMSALPGEKLLQSLTELQQLLEREKKLDKAPQKCDWDSYKKHRKEFKACTAEISRFLKENAKTLYQLLPVIMTECAKLYGGAAQTLDGALKRWRKEKPTLQSTAEFLDKAYEARKHVEKSWQLHQAWHGDDSSTEANEDSSSGANPWGRYGDPASSSSAVSDAKKRKSKKAGKPKKSGKTPKKTKKLSEEGELVRVDCGDGEKTKKSKLRTDSADVRPKEIATKDDMTSHPSTAGGTTSMQPDNIEEPKESLEVCNDE